MPLQILKIGITRPVVGPIASPVCSILLDPDKRFIAASLYTSLGAPYFANFTSVYQLCTSYCASGPVQALGYLVSTVLNLVAELRVIVAVGVPVTARNEKTRLNGAALVE